MKVTLAIPSVRLPRVPSIHIYPKNPKVRIPFLSLLVEPRSLEKWLLIWIFCLYLAFCFACFFEFEQPRLNHDTFIRFGADSPTYWEAVAYRSEHAQNENLISFTGNLLGPVVIGMIFKSGLAVAFFNIFLFFVAVEIACTIPGVDRYLLVFLLAISAETAPALVTLNKEILVLLSAMLLAKFIYLEKTSWFLLAAALFVSVFARWEQIAVILLFLFLRRKGSFFRRNPRLAILSVIAALTVSYTLIAGFLTPASVRSRNIRRGPTPSSSSMTSRHPSAFPWFSCRKSSWISWANCLRPADIFAGVWAASELAICTPCSSFRCSRLH